MPLRIPDNTTVSPTGLPNARFRTAASPTLLAGDAAGQAQRGRALQSVSNDVGNIALQEQENINLAKVAASDAALGQELLKYEDELRSRRGLAAEKVAQDANDWWEKTSSKYVSELDNDAQRRAFQQIMARKRESSLSRLTTYQRSELERARKEAMQASIVNDINEAAANAGDDEAVAMNLTNLTSKVDAIAQTEGWVGEEGEKIKQAYLEEQRTLAHSKVIDRLMIANPQAARDYYTRNMKDIAGGSRANIESKLKASNDRATAQAATDEIMRKQMTESEALAEARKRYKNSPDVRDAVVQRLKVRYAEDEKIRQADQTLAANEAWKIVTGDQFTTGIETIDDLPIDLFNRLSGQDRKAISDYLYKKATTDNSENDWRVLTSVEQMIENGDITDPNQLEPYRPYLTETTFSGLRNSINKRDEVPASDVLKAFELRIGETRAKFMDNDDDRENWLAFKHYLLDRVKETRRPEDIDVWADRWFMEGYTREDRWGDDPDTFGEAQIAGRDDFMIEAPKDARANVLTAITVLGNAGYEVQTGEAAVDEFYTRYQLDAEQYLRARDFDPNPLYVAAYAYLRQSGNPVTPANLNYIATQLRAGNAD